jgi:hypothetical protein
VLDATKQHALDLAVTARRLKRFRDDLNHGLWGANHPAEVQIADYRYDAIKARSSPADITSLQKYADEIAELNAALIALAVVRHHVPPPEPRRVSSSLGLTNRTHPSQATNDRPLGLLGSPPETDE